MTYEVHVVELQSLERGDHAFVQVLARQTDAIDRVAIRAATTEELRRDHEVHALPQTALHALLQALSQHSL